MLINCCFLASERPTNQKALKYIVKGSRAVLWQCSVASGNLLWPFQGGEGMLSNQDKMAGNRSQKFVWEFKVT